MVRWACKELIAVFSGDERREMPWWGKVRCTGRGVIMTTITKNIMFTLFFCWCGAGSMQGAERQCEQGLRYNICECFFTSRNTENMCPSTKGADS